MVPPEAWLAIGLVILLGLIIFVMVRADKKKKVRRQTQIVTHETTTSDGAVHQETIVEDRTPVLSAPTLSEAVTPDERDCFLRYSGQLELDDDLTASIETHRRALRGQGGDQCLNETAIDILRASIKVILQAFIEQRRRISLGLVDTTDQEKREACKERIATCERIEHRLHGILESGQDILGLLIGDTVEIHTQDHRPRRGSARVTTQTTATEE